MGTATTAPLSLEDGNRLVVEHLDLVQHAVNQVSMRYPQHVDRQELWNAGALGLVDAARRYDPETGIPFPRYAMIRVRGAIIDSTRNRDWATRTLRRGMRRVRRANEDFAQQHGRQPTSAELAHALDIDVDKLDAYRAAAAASHLLHLDQRVGSGDGDDDTTLGDLVAEDDHELRPEDSLEDQELIGTLRVAVEHLPQPQRDVIARYYFDGEYLRDIADDMGVTEARVSQIRAEALNAVRAYFSTAFDGIPDVPESAPGRRARAAFVTRMRDESTWRTRLDASNEVRELDQRARSSPPSAPTLLDQRARSSPPSAPTLLDQPA